jgi:hypothetical protein
MSMAFFPRSFLEWPPTQSFFSKTILRSFKEKQKSLNKNKFEKAISTLIAPNLIITKFFERAVIGFSRQSQKHFPPNGLFFAQNENKNDEQSHGNRTLGNK